MVAYRILTGVLLLLLSGLATASTFTATVDRKELFINEHIVLTLALHDSETRLRAEGVSPNIDLTLLSDQFELGTPRADFRFNIERNRGRSSSTITVELFPRKSGRLSIPSFTVDGLSTEPIRIQVLEQRADGTAAEVFAVSGVGTHKLRVHEQSLVFLDLYHRVDLETARLGGPLETRPQQIELHLLPQQNRVETVNGIEYQVTRTAWALSPLTGEDITVSLPDVWIETQQGRKWRLPFSEQRIDVTSLPASVSTGTLIGRPSVSIDAPATGQAGRLMPWEITLRTTMALNALPAELPFGEHSGDLRIFMDPPLRRHEMRTDGGIESVAVYRGSVMPLAPGVFTLPALELPWFDTETGRLESLSVPGRIVQVSGTPVTGTDGDSAGESGMVPAASATTALRIWQAVAALLLLSWLLAAVLWWRRRIAPRAGRGGGRTRPIASGHPARDRLLVALGSRTLEQGLRTHELHNGVDEELRAVVTDVQRRCYHPGSVNGTEAELQQRVDRVVERLHREPRPSADQSEDKWSPRAFHPAQRNSTGSGPI